MALMKCRECGHEVSRKAEKCPNCGAPLKPKQIGCCSGVLVFIVGMVLIGYIIVYIGDCISTPSYRPSSQRSTTEMEKPKIDYNQRPTAEMEKPKIDYKEIRTSNISALNIRKGPGANYGLDDSGTLFEGESLYVLEEKDGWIRFRVTENDVGWEGWASKKYTIPLDIYDTDKWKKAGVLVRIDYKTNEAFVNPQAWYNLDIISKGSFAFEMAWSCEINGNERWVDIIDSKTGKKLSSHDSGF